ncbi:MAG: hypothetical protein JSW20_04250 [Nitrospiraceae bacterium]|nr:MAG: hypothetical protein JSW20_04250 [Nitrospiraceae bacterium]
MIYRDYFFEDKQTQINRWISQLARLDALCREAGDDVRIKFEVQLQEFSEHLEQLKNIFCDVEKLNIDSREKFNSLVEKNWNDLQESFERSVSEYEYLCRAGMK